MFRRALRGWRLRQSAVIALIVYAGISAHAADPVPSTFASEVLAPEESIVVPLLRVVCGEGVRTVKPNGEKAFGCGDGEMEEMVARRHLPRRYPWSPYVLWQADGILFGHFLSPTSDDVAISCLGCDGHPNLWSGTLLLTRKSGVWEPVWYKPGIVMRHCRRVTLATGRQILFCEETDGGMGHRIHGLYTIDFTKPAFAWDSLVLEADTYSDPGFGGAQTQFIDRVWFEGEPGAVVVRVQARHGRIRVDYDSKSVPVPKLSSYEIEFRLAGDELKVTRQSSAAARLFGVD